MWAVAPSTGLVRRARRDLESADPQIVAETDGEITLELGGHRVSLDMGGPATARCDCPSTGVCRHIIAAGIWFGATDPATDSSAPQGDHPTIGPHDQLLALTEADLLAHAGRVGYRWAADHAAVLESSPDTTTGPVRITLTDPPVSLTFPGGDLDAMLPDRRILQLPRVRVCAILSYQRAHGVNVVTAAAVAPSAADLRKSEHRSAVRMSVRQLLLDTAAMGTAHVSDSTAERFDAAAITAQTADHFRLAALLRRIGDHCRQLVARTAGAGEGHLIEDLSLALALLAALDAAEPVPPIRLLGTARTGYEEVGDLELFGLGAYPWRTASGYHGVTAVLWWPEQQRFLTVSDARPLTSVAFDPVQRYHAREPVWPGVASLRSLTGARIMLQGAKINSAGRLSRGQGVEASADPLDSARIGAQCKPVRSWHELSPAGAAIGLLDIADPNADWVVVAPAAFATPRFDEVRQVLNWPLIDNQGAEIVATVEFSDITAPAVERLSGVVVEPGTWVVGRLRRDATGLTVMPVSFLRPRRASDEHPIDAIHFDSAPGDVLGGPVATASATPPMAPSPHDLLRIQGWLTRVVERGTTGREPALRVELAQRQHALRDNGFSIFTDSPDPDVPLPELLLRAYAVAEQVRRIG